MTTLVDSPQSPFPRWRWVPRRLHQLGLLVGAVAVLVVGSQSVAGADIPERYPYDPACPWGRVADGNGMMVRCLDPAEAKQLLQISGAPASAARAEPPQQPASSSPATPVAPEPKAVPTRIAVESVGPAVADAGELPLAGSKLGLAKDKFVQCAVQHGGLTAKQAKVVVRFLVREKGRAEGVGIKSHAGVSLAAAQCIAEVVNLRYVGYPAAPIVGATIPIVLSAQP